VENAPAIPGFAAKMRVRLAAAISCKHSVSKTGWFLTRTGSASGREIQ
jgi:hypothetical protein